MFISRKKTTKQKIEFHLNDEKIYESDLLSMLEKNYFKY